jgi:hypothetical protein
MSRSLVGTAGDILEINSADNKDCHFLLSYHLSWPYNGRMFIIWSVMAL